MQTDRYISNFTDFLRRSICNNMRGLRKFTENPNPEYDWAHEEVSHVADADVIISKSNMDPNTHYPVLDLDIPHQYYDSSTPFHGHLYLDTPLTWRKYKRLLRELARAGIIEKGYVSASIDRGYTSVRLPWIKKGQQVD